MPLRINSPIRRSPRSPVYPAARNPSVLGTASTGGGGGAGPALKFDLASNSMYLALKSVGV